MTANRGKRPAEIFGYPIRDQTPEARRVRSAHQCPFKGRTCGKQSRLLDIPFGVCSAELNGQVRALCADRFTQQGSFAGVPRVFENIAKHHFGDTNNIVFFPEFKLPNVGNIDYVIVRHKAMSPVVDDFVAVEFQADSTTSTGRLVGAMNDFMGGEDVTGQSYQFGFNTYDSIKRAMTQLMNKGIVYETWGSKCYWVMQDYIYQNLVTRYGFKKDGYSPEHATRFALYDIVTNGERLDLEPTRFISTTVDEVYQAMRKNPRMPRKDHFVQRLNDRLRLELSLGK